MTPRAPAVLRRSAATQPRLLHMFETLIAAAMRLVPPADQPLYDPVASTM
jgi:hypothetical protein